MAIVIKKAAARPATPPPSSSAPDALLDRRCRECVARNINCSVAWLMMASYGYYKCDEPILSDGTYDWLARFIGQNWDKISHPHKRFLNRESLLSTSSLELADGVGLMSYPNQTRSAYLRLANSIGAHPRVFFSFPGKGGKVGAGYRLE